MHGMVTGHMRTWTFALLLTSAIGATSQDELPRNLELGNTVNPQRIQDVVNKAIAKVSCKYLKLEAISVTNQGAKKG